MMAVIPTRLATPRMMPSMGQQGAELVRPTSLRPAMMVGNRLMTSENAIRRTDVRMDSSRSNDWAFLTHNAGLEWD
jgi:hypothetical protein